MAQTALIAAFLAGLTGGLHCAAMCGGWFAATSARGANASAPLIPARTLAFDTLAIHAGRVVTYVMLGALLGAAGGAVFAVTWEPVQRALYVVANLFLLSMAFSLARAARGPDRLEGAGLALFRKISPLVRPLVSRPGLPTSFALGLVWGLTPCALIYGVLPVAMLSGGPAQGALVMLAFGVGTLPHWLAATWLWPRARAIAGRAQMRMAAGWVVGAFAVAGLYRAFFVEGALGSGPFCLMP